jgi:tetratricopeptide (TPR) repeat protein
MNKKQDTVVLFPNLLHRLQQKGFEALHEKRFAEALQCFDQLAEHGLQEERTELAAIVCLMELNELQEAKKRCELLFQHSRQVNYDVIEMYITILIQLHNYEELEETIQSVLESQKLADEQKEKLLSLLSFAKKMNVKEESHAISEYEELAPVFEGQNLTLQLQAIKQIKEHGSVRPFPFLLAFLRDETKHPFVKSLIISLFIEAGIEKEMEIEKFGKRMTINPSALEDVRKWGFSNHVISIFEQHIANENPTLFEAMKEHWYQISYIFYPFVPKPSDEAVWAAVLHKAGWERFIGEMPDQEIERIYNVEKEEVLEAYGVFLHIEKEGCINV